MTTTNSIPASVAEKLRAGSRVLVRDRALAVFVFAVIASLSFIVIRRLDVAVARSSVLLSA
jgi:hypothetical protein